MTTALLALVVVSRAQAGTPIQGSPIQGSPIQGSPVAYAMTAPEPFAKAERMLRTPKLDGVISPDEWDALFDYRPKPMMAASGGAQASQSMTGQPTAGQAGTGQASAGQVSNAQGTATNLPPLPGSGNLGGATPAPPPSNIPNLPAGGSGTGTGSGGGQAPDAPKPLTGTPRKPPTPSPSMPAPSAPASVPSNPAPSNPAPSNSAPANPAPATPATGVPATGTPANTTGAGGSGMAAGTAATNGALAAFMNWEPGTVYLAGVVPAGQDLVVSLDGKGDGFLVGRDNLELRVSQTANGPVLKARMLDATNPSGPIWVNAPGFVTASKVASATSNGQTTYEIGLVDPGYGIAPGKLGDSYGVRFDAAPASGAVTEPFLPRTTTPVKLVDLWTEGLPPNLKISVPAKGRGAFPLDSTTVHWTFNGTPGTSLSRLEVEGEGWLGDYVNSLGVPSPEFDGRGNATVDYDTKVARGAPIGYGVLKGIVSGSGWGPSTVEVSFRVPPPIDMDIAARQLKYSEKPQRFKASVAIRSNSDKRVEGHLQVQAPAGWTVRSGSDKNFFIYDKRGTVLNGFEVEVPGGVRGSFPINLRVAALGGFVDQSFWVTIP